MERIHISVHGGEIQSGDLAKMKAQLSYYMGDAPSDASLCSCLSIEKSGLAFNLQVHSAQGHLFIHREGLTLSTLMKFVYESLERSLKDWRKSPESFKKKHPMIQNPCRGASHRSINCPTNAFSNQASQGES